jgi:hypothetical protein
MSAYEAEREARIAANNQLLNTLGLHASRDKLGRINKNPIHARFSVPLTKSAIRSTLETESFLFLAQ